MPIRGRGRAGEASELLARCVHAYPAERGVPDQDASYGRTGSGSRDLSLATAVSPVELRSHATPARSAHRRRSRRPNLVVQAPFRRAPSGTSPAVRYLHKATSSFLANATAAIFRTRPRAAPTRSVN